MSAADEEQKYKYLKNGQRAYLYQVYFLGNLWALNIGKLYFYAKII